VTIPPRRLMNHVPTAIPIAGILLWQNSADFEIAFQQLGMRSRMRGAIHSGRNARYFRVACFGGVAGLLTPPCFFSVIGSGRRKPTLALLGRTQSSACLQGGVREQFRPLLFVSVCHASMVSFLNTTFLSSTAPLISKAV
jgi:hypothetical protein